MQVARWQWAVLVAGAVAFACGDDGGTNPPGLQYPDIPDAMRRGMCVRAEVTVGSTMNGRITPADCDLGDSYYETYLLKVASDRAVTISMTSPDFDTFLILLRLNSISPTSANLTEVARDDDSGTDLNARIANVMLRASEDYVVVADGYAYADTGAYVLEIR